MKARHEQPNLIFQGHNFFPYKSNLSHNLENKIYFESKLAVVLMSKAQVNTVAFQVSKAIVDLIDNHEAEIINLFARNIHLFDEFRKALFGKKFLGLILDDQKDNLHDILDDIKFILSKEQSILQHVLPLHSAFGYSVIKNLNLMTSQEITYANLHKKAYVIDSKDPYEKINLKEILEESKETVLSNKFGILSSLSPYAGLVGECYEEHERAVDRYIIDRNKHREKIFEVFGSIDIPLVAGPSRHTLNALSSAYALTLKQPEQFQEYVGLYACYLIVSGHHSFHEVVIIAQFPNFDVEYIVDNYTRYLPVSFKQSSEYSSLIEDPSFSIYLSNGTNDNKDKVDSIPLEGRSSAM